MNRALLIAANVLRVCAVAVDISEHTDPLKPDQNLVIIV